MADSSATATAAATNSQTPSDREKRLVQGIVWCMLLMLVFDSLAAIATVVLYSVSSINVDGSDGENGSSWGILTALRQQQQHGRASMMLECKCPPRSLMNDTRGDASSAEQNFDAVDDGYLSLSGGVGSDAERNITDCRAVWVRGPLSRVFICRFAFATATAAAAADQENNQNKKKKTNSNALAKLRRDLLILKTLSSSSHTAASPDDLSSVLREVQRSKRREQLQQPQSQPLANRDQSEATETTTTTTTTTTAEQQQQQQQAAEQLSRVLESVLDGSGCIMSAPQFRDLIEQRVWIDLALFERETE
jgi:hypothetical protein